VHGTHNGLTTGVNMYVFDRDFLLPVAAIPLQGLKL
jgi:hypothetical protein